MPFDNTPTRIDTDASLLIERARALIDRPEKWANKGPEPARHCILQALSRAGGIEPAVYRAMGAAVWRRGFSTIGEFNDHPSTTHTDVLACMNEARLDAMEDAPAGHVAGPFVGMNGTRPSEEQEPQ